MPESWRDVWVYLICSRRTRAQGPIQALLFGPCGLALSEVCDKEEGHIPTIKYFDVLLSGIIGSRMGCSLTHISTIYSIYYIYLYIIYRYGHNKPYVLPKSTVSQVIPRKSDTPRKQAKWFRYKKGWEQDWQNPSRMGGISILHFDWESKIIIELEMNSEDPKRSMKAPLLLV